MLSVPIFTPSIAALPADTRENVVSEALPSSRDHIPSAVDVDETSPDIGSPVQFVRVPDVGVPRSGVTRVGEVPNTSDPDPVSSLITPASCTDVVDANTDRLFAVRATIPAKSGRVQVLAAVIVFVNSPVNVFATFRSPKVVSLNVFNAVTV